MGGGGNVCVINVACIRAGVGEQGEHLVIHNVTRMCADYYMCIADNKVPPATKMEFSVDVNCT